MKTFLDKKTGKVFSYYNTICPVCHEKWFCNGRQFRADNITRDASLNYRNQPIKKTCTKCARVSKIKIQKAGFGAKGNIFRKLVRDEQEY